MKAKPIQIKYILSLELLIILSLIILSWLFKDSEKYINHLFKIIFLGIALMGWVVIGVLRFKYKWKGSDPGVDILLILWVLFLLLYSTMGLYVK